MAKQETKTKTVQKTAQKAILETPLDKTQRLDPERGVVQRTGRWLWLHKGQMAHYAATVAVVVLMVSGANKLVFGRVFPK